MLLAYSSLPQVNSKASIGPCKIFSYSRRVIVISEDHISAIVLGWEDPSLVIDYVNKLIPLDLSVATQKIMLDKPVTNIAI